MPDKKRTATGALGGLAGLVGLSAVAGLLVTATVTPAIAVSGAAASGAIDLFENMPSYLEIDEVMQPTELFVKNSDTGEDFLLTQFYEQNRSVVTFDQISTVMYDAILSSEDPRYYQHGGVDLIGTTRALLSNAAGGATQGGSSISQQYVKNVLIQRCEANAEPEIAEDGTEVVSLADARAKCFLEATQSSGLEGYERKLQEMRYAIQLEKEYSKNEILLAYLNIANFGGVTYSVDAAAKYYFNVPASQLSVSQAAILAGVVQNPNLYRIDGQSGSADNNAPDGVVGTPDVLAALNTKLESGAITQEQYLAAADGYTATKGRQLYVLSRLLEDGKITQEQYDAAVLEPISPTITPALTGCETTGAAAYFCQYAVSVIRNDPAFGETAEDRQRALLRGGLRVYLTMDNRVQKASEDAIAEYAPVTMPNTKYGSTSVSVEAGTGRVLAIAQNTKFTEDRDLAASDPAYTSIVYAGDPVFGSSIGFSAGSTFKLFTLIDWLEKGHSVNESVDGRVRVIRNFTGCGDTIINPSWKANNFGGGGGSVGTPMSFTASSLNSGYVAMASELDLCDISNVAAKMGVSSNSEVVKDDAGQVVLDENGDPVTRTGSPLTDSADPITLNGPASVIGPAAVSPMAMAGAFATVASGGTYCEPQIIDRVTDADGNELPKPERTCTQVLTPEVAATAAYALAGVMRGTGTGSRANPNDGVAVLGKTGSHELLQTWMVESSTKVSTAVWAGNADGDLNPFRNSYRGRVLSEIRYPIARDVQSVANDIYGGAPSFPRPADTLLRQVQVDLPSVIGQTVEQAQATLREAGFDSLVGDPVDSDQPAGLVAQQDPGAGRVPSGSTITIRPSTGQGTPVPSVAGTDLNTARQTLNAAGFTNLTGSCTADPSAPAGGLVTGTDPAAQTVTNTGTAIAVSYSAPRCQ